MFTPAQSHSQTLLEHYDYAIVCILGLIFVCKSVCTLCKLLLSCCCDLATYIGVVGRMSGKPLLLPEIYSGESQCWSDWIEHFESVAALNKWATEDEKLKWLKVRLAGKARTAFQKLPRNVREEYG